MEILALAIVMLGIFGLVSGAVANSRGHGFLPFFILGALISPVLAIILCFVISPPRKSSKRRLGRNTTRGAKKFRTGVHRPAQRDKNPFAPPARNSSNY